MDVQWVWNADVNATLKKNVKKDWSLRQWFPLRIYIIWTCMITDFQLKGAYAHMHMHIL
jgi:hypothetical protein